MQGIWVFITLLPTLLLNLEKNGKPLGFWDYLGWSIWAVGFTTEAVADQQKWHFRSNPDNADKFIQSGLWAYSRHPNYLGEILLWTGLFVSATSVLHGWQYVSVLSPLLVWFLLSHVSGVPILEKAAMKKWGKQAAFQAYLRETPMLWPVSLRL
uniref:Steroid 5-alpha reductase C-terminal domain-containing protein n=2 Tax=Varanus komodoensis TaxID=61221 RepID=A0A8D2J128_VARKO